jgi:adenine phosphoribosyltransferase
MNIAKLKNTIRSIPDFPKKGIMFRDITTLLQNEKAFRATIDIFAKKYAKKNIQKVVGIESRGFIFGAALAYKLKCGFIPVRKPKKLPSTTIRQEYHLEYGTDTIEIHNDAIERGEKILLVDDLLATGGTMEATTKLVEKLRGKIVGIAFVIELDFLNGKKKLNNYDVFSLMHYANE